MVSVAVFCEDHKDLGFMTRRVTIDCKMLKNVIGRVFSREHLPSQCRCIPDIYCVRNTAFQHSFPHLSLSGKNLFHFPPSTDNVNDDCLYFSS